MRGTRVLLLAAAAGLVPCLLIGDETLPPLEIKVGQSIIHVAFAPGKIDAPESAVEAWITKAAKAVAAYFGRFPAAQVRILVRPVEGRSGVFNATTYGSSFRAPGPFTRISIGESTSQQELDRDWTMTHELVHMAFPDIAGDTREHHWIEEGMATYIEPIARAQIGDLTAERVWADMVRYVPQGLPQEGDRGLDNTHTWGRTYWGGALFWLLADVQVRESTKNRKGLQDAMRGILNAGGSIEQEWPIERVLEVGDQATGCTALVDLYNQMKATPVHTDLAALWKRLGIEVSEGEVRYNDRAPLANIRKAIMARREP
jgi:hypothetical protein